MAVFIAAASVLYCCVFFMKGVKRKLAALSAVDAVILALLFIDGAGPAAIAAFLASAAALNVALFFIPEGGSAVFGVKDIFFMALNACLAAGAGIFAFINAGAVPAKHSPPPAMAAFVFMALTVAGYFVLPRGNGENK